VGTGLGNGTVVVRIGTASQPMPSHSPVSRAAAAWAQPRAEVLLATRVRGWSLGTLPKTKLFGQV
jgi:hypothetical protein